MKRKTSNSLTMEPEKLRPELIAAIADPDEGLIHHPLLVTQLFSPNDPAEIAKLNTMFLGKRKLLRECKAERNFFGYLVLFERPYRLNAFKKLVPMLNDQEYWNLLGHIWTDINFAYSHLRTWRKLFASDRPGRSGLMDDDECAVLAAMPDTLTIYRGAKSSEGLAWTLSEEKAKWFADRFNFDKKDRVFKGTVPKDKVYAYLDGRNEQEIVVDPRHVTVE